MKLKRRKFLLLSSLGGFGLAACSKLFAVAESHSTPNHPTSGATPAEDELLLRFVTVADTGTGARGQYQVANAMTQRYQQFPYSLVLLAGDNIYTNGEFEKIEQVFERPYAPLLSQGVKFHAVLGNHDVREQNGDRQITYPGFNMGGRYYTFRQGDVQFFGLDTNLYYTRSPQNNPAGDAQTAWLERELSQSDAPWKVVFGHHQIYSSGHYGVNQAFVAKFAPMFQKYGVQLYVNGHDHHYERSHPINGTTYLICGAGAGTRSVSQNDFSAYAAEMLSFAVIEVYRDRAMIRGIDTNHTVFDQGIIERVTLA
ncbi:MAG: metallophosphoesterase [Jaaginema sp. PMC 1079.18]|nr:metallophosphoesterase [Jaaginema sp. PMC 1080.18]MEC4853806.1 metallophosphoesterase [Jaaginema sp. PMC 1079.18]MEC4867344.1 metallophosphoesterase [Jaaginema sp. PMC 1078.18]